MRARALILRQATMGLARLAFRWASFRMCLMLFICYFVIRGIILAPLHGRLSEVCANIVARKQSFLETNANGVRCEELSPATTMAPNGRGDRPNNEYDIQEFMFQSKRETESSTTRGVTVAVQLSIDRLQNLERLGNSWGGPVSASVYIPHPRHTPAAKAMLSTLSNFHKSISSKGAFGLDLGIIFGLDGIEEMNAALSDTIASQDVSAMERYRYMYPVNAGRNVALAQVRTDLTLLLDVDFVVSSDAWKAASGANPHWNNVLCEIRRRVPLGLGMFAVFPAFESGKDRAPPLDKKSLVFSYKQGFVRRMSGNLITHCPTDYQYWMESDADYVIQYGPFFEPYGIAATEMIPWFPENFKGYHLNKIMVYFAMAAKGWDFIVLPDHFVVHVWHSPSDSRNVTFGNPEIMQLIHKFKDEFVVRLAEGGDTCSPEIVAQALRPKTRVLKGKEIKSEPVGLIDDIHKFHEVSCAQLTGMGRKA